MWRRQLPFFQPAEPLPPSVQFLDLKKIPEAIFELYRGFNTVLPVMFGLPTVLTGIFGKTFPKVISIEEIRLHKLTNLSNDYHMVSTSEDPQVARHWGQECFITIDPTLIRPFIVDVHESYSHHYVNLPGRMEHELEHVALAVPYCCVKKICIKGEEIINPFYLAIDHDNQEAIQVFHPIYREFIDLLRNKYTQPFNEDEEKLALRHYVTAYLQFYNKYSGSSNPFTQTFQELAELHPTFMTHFLTLNPQSERDGLMGDAAMMKIDHVFKEHYYTQSLNDAELARPKVATTFYEDPWARPNYD
jgi:hypothetical protein